MGEKVLGSERCQIEILRPETNEPRQEHQRKAIVKINPSAVRLLPMQSKTASGPRRYLAASAWTKGNVEKATLSVTPLARHQPHRSRRRETVDRFLRKVELTEESVLMVENSISCVTCLSRRLALIHRVTTGILCECQQHKTREDYSYDERCVFLHSEKSQQPSRR